MFELSPPPVAGRLWTETILRQTIGSGEQPEGGLIADSKGNLYGTTTGGVGTVFELSPPAADGSAWTETLLYQFTGGNDGAEPYGGLVADSKWNLHGTTPSGNVTEGSRTPGTVFELTNTGFVTDVPFAAFNSNLELQFGRRPNTDSFELLSEFKLGKTSTGVDPLTDPLTLTIGTYTTTLPSGSFQKPWHGQPYYFFGQINGVDLEAAIAQTDEKRFEFAATAWNADLAGTTNPVPVTLTIGNNTGTDSIRLPKRGW